MSNETKFTKGEWFIAGRHVESETGKLIHQISGGYVAQSESETANAHLIKTAPKLYKMLDTVRQVLSGDSEYNADNISVDYIRKLLAEARGE